MVTGAVHSGGDRDIEASLHDHLQRHVLQPGEHVVWTGRPHKVRATQLAKRPSVIGAIVLVFISIWIRGTIDEAGSGWSSIDSWRYVFLLVPVIFITLGMYLVTTPFRLRGAAKRTLYAVTDRRVIILQGGRFFRVNAHLPDSIKDFEKVRRREGWDDIVLRKTAASDTMTNIYLSGLWGIDDVDDAVDAINAIGGT